MIIFKTRHEVRELKREVQRHNDIMEALRAHFDIKYTMEDFAKYCELFPDVKDIPVSVGEFLHMYEMLSPSVRTMSYRGKELMPKEN